MTEHYDVTIVGTRAGGDTLARTLAPSGKRILLLERGDFLPREMDNCDFYFAGNGREWPLGNIQMCGKSNAEAMKGEEPKLTMLAPHRHRVLDKNFYMNISIPIAGCADQAGTGRFGDDPATSVLDVNCKAGPHRHGQRHPGRRASAKPDVVNHILTGGDRVYHR